MPVQQDHYGPPRPGVDKFPANAVIPRHRHHHGYASVVLAGSFTEASFWGLMPAQPGDVLLHGRFDCHSDYGQGGTCKVQILRLPCATIVSKDIFASAIPTNWSASQKRTRRTPCRYWLKESARRK